MQLTEILNFFIAALLNVIFCIFIIEKIFEVRPKKSKFRKVLIIILTSIGMATVNFYNKDFFKTLLTIPITSYGISKLFNIRLTTSLIYMLVASFYQLISELLLGIIFSVLPLDYSFLFNNILGRISGCLLVVAITYPFLCIKILKLFFKKITKIKTINNRLITVLSISFFVLVSALMYKNARSIDNKVSAIVNAIIFLMFAIVIYFYYVELDKEEEKSKEYNNLLKYLKLYEKELIEKRKIVHDYKNQLIIIKGLMCEKSKLEEYVNELIKEQKNYNSSLIIKNIDKLPKGLKGLIYYKLSELAHNVNIDLQIKTNLKKFDKISPKLNSEILKIIGILLDNAIEASINSKEKNLEIMFYIENNNFVMQIKNSFNSEIEKDKIMNLGYTTKGKGRGYGLSIVEEIIKKEKSINLEIEIIKNIYSVKLVSKI